MGKVMTTAKKLGSQGTLRKSCNLPSVDQSVNDPRDALSFVIIEIWDRTYDKRFRIFFRY